MKMAGEGLRLVLGLLFLWAGVVKMKDPYGFQEHLLAYQLLPFALTGVVALFLPALEALLGLALILRRWEIESLWWILVLTGGFAFGLGSAWIRGLNIECGCFGAADLSGTYAWWLFRDLALFAAAWLRLRQLGDSPVRHKTRLVNGA